MLVFRASTRAFQYGGSVAAVATRRVAPAASCRVLAGRSFAEWAPAEVQKRPIEEVRSSLQDHIDAKPELYGSISGDGMNYENFSKLVEEVCPSMGETERYALFTSMDMSGDFLIQDEELFSDVVLRVLRTRSEAQEKLHPVQGSYASLPRPPFVHDPSQMGTLEKLITVYDEVVGDWRNGEVRYTKKPAPKSAKPAPPAGGGFMSSLFGSKKKAPEPVKAAPEKYVAPNYEARKGLYIVGSSGSGKTALLNVFFRSLPEGFPVVRLHWHEFCRDGFRHMGLAAARQKQEKGRTAFEIMADEIVGHCRVFLLDCVNITAVAEGVLVKELFRELWLRGVTVVVTSNYRCSQLYHQGFNRASIEDFFPEFEERCPEIDISCDVDYRTVGIAESGNFIVGLTPENVAANEKKFEELTGEFEKDAQLPVPHEKRNLHIPAVNHEKGIARFNFAQLCGKPLGRADYTLIATSYHTIFVDNIPKLGPNEGVEFKRFVSFVDMVYDKKVNLHTLSEVPCPEIYTGTTKDLHLDEQFAWGRTQSMLTEMQSTKYQSMAWLMRRHLVQESSTNLMSQSSPSQ